MRLMFGQLGVPATAMEAASEAPEQQEEGLLLLTTDSDSVGGSRTPSSYCSGVRPAGSIVLACNWTKVHGIWHQVQHLGIA